MKKIIYIFIFILLIAGVSSNAQPLSGSYTINSAMSTGGTNFQSITDFSSRLNLNGISASVIATITPGSGPYVEQVVFNNIAGTSASNTITLDGSGETVTALTDSSKRYIIRLQDMQFMTIYNINILRDTAAASGFLGIHIYNTGNDITISNCNVIIPGTTSTLTGGYIASGSQTAILGTGDFHNITFSGNTSTGGGYGVSVFGLISNLASGIVITRNTFYDFHSNGIYLRETNGAEISYNNFDKRTSNITTVNAILIAQAANINSSIFGNDIRVSQTSNGMQNFRGIYLFDGTGHKVYNNVIHDIHLISGNFTAILVRTAGTAPEISFNTISIDTQATSSGNLYGIEEELSNTNSIIRNNVISITQLGANMAAFSLGNLSTLSTAFNSNYNDLYIPSGNVAIKRSTTPTLYQTLSNWQTASGQDATSTDAIPGFVSSTFPIPSSPALDNTGITIPGIVDDILGNLRNIPPDMGAYEFFAQGIKFSVSNQKAMTIYPNPAKETISIKLPQGIFSRMAYKIYDELGKIAGYGIFQTGIDPTVANFSVHTLNTGVYYILIRSNERDYSTSFVKE